MKYRGQDYSQFQQQVSTIPSQELLCYRGCEYHIPKPVAINQPQIPDFQRRDLYTYRGVSYTKAYHHFPSKPRKTLVRH